MQKRFIVFLVSILFVFVFVNSVLLPKATAHDGLHTGGEEVDGEDIDDLQDKIKELEDKVKDLQNEEKSLQNEITYFNSQISLTELRIQNAEAEIAKRTKLLGELIDDISNLSERIDKLSESIDYQTNILEERMRARYKSQTDSPVVILFGSDTLATAVKKATYLKVMQKQDQELLDQMENTKQAYGLQKNLFEEKKSETEEIKARVEAEKANLLAYNNDLNNQKTSKQRLLEETQNDEAKYQDQLRKARAELDAIQGIVAGIDFRNGTKIEKGDVIAVMGNSGYPDCSTGAHLHLEIRKDGKLQNPEKYLKSKKVYVNDFSSGYKEIGDGDWGWPMKDPEITQMYGDTPWSWRYPSGRHDGFDMIADDTFIYAPDDGILVKGQMGCYNSVINYAAIDHGDDVISYYLHIR